MGMRSFVRPVLALALVTLTPLAARAQADASSRAMAVQLFDEAEALFAKDQIALACPKYAESYRLDPQLGVLVYLAECYEKSGQLASAWGSFREAEEIARKRGDARGDHARDRAAALEPRLSRLVIEVPEQVRVPGLMILRDSAPLTSVVWGTPVAIDTGLHRVEARAPGYEPWQAEVTITDEGSVAQLTVPLLVALPPSADARAGLDGNSRDGAPSPVTARRIAAIAVGGVGIVGVGVGGFFGLSAQSSFSDSKELCNGDEYCTPQGAELRSSAKTKALVATVAVGVGAAALVTAGVLWFTAPKAEPRAGLTRAKPARRWAVGPTTDAWGLEVRHAF